MAKTATKTSKTPKTPPGSARATAAAPAEPLRGRIPALTPAHAEASRSLFSAPHHWRLRDAGVFTLKPSHGGSGETFELDADGARASLRLHATEAAPSAGSLRWSDYVGRSRLLAWSLAHEPLLMRLSEALGTALLPVATSADDALDTDATAAQESLWFDFALTGTASDASAHRGALRMPLDWLPPLLARAQPQTDEDITSRLAHWRALPLSVALRLPGPTVASIDWGALRPGDVLILGTRGTLPPPHAYASDRRWPLTRVAEGWRIDGPDAPLPPSQESSAMNDHEPGAPATTESATDTNGAEKASSHGAGNHAHVHDLPVRVEFELGKLELSLGDLAALQPGYVFALSAALEGANVVIRANGRDAGRGEVVAVGETLGVRLLSWN